jgi:hypothetical protein
MNEINYKNCTKCQVLKLATPDFFARAKLGKYGLSAWCKSCGKIYREINSEKLKSKKAEYYSKNKEKIGLKVAAYYEKNRDAIGVYNAEYCKKNKEKIALRFANYYLDNKDVIREKNKNYISKNFINVSLKKKQYQEKNREKILKDKKKYYEENKEQYLESNANWKKQNIEKAKKLVEIWHKNNHTKVIAIRSKRRAAKINASPSWLNDEHKRKIEILFNEAALLSERGFKHHVDHIVPLQGKKVCGLHVPWNLRVIPANINIKKKNKIPSTLPSIRFF